MGGVEGKLIFRDTTTEICHQSGCQQQQQQHKLYLHDYSYVVTVLQTTGLSGNVHCKRGRVKLMQTVE